jgi:heme a synthase
MNGDSNQRYGKGVSAWLKWIALMIFIMVVIGGATRLTDSGLSITEWQPIMGAIPPLNSADWAVAFEKYKQIPEFKIQNSQMTLSEFQFIYWWEWVHRFWGRLIGIAFVVPFFAFAAMRRLSFGLTIKLLILLVLGSAQGALGWYMVQSGLVNQIDVSQYRLAAHLTLASILLAAVLWVAWSVRSRHQLLASGIHGPVALLLFLGVMVQVAAGGLVAGLDAGQGYQTWPKMDGAWIPAGLDVMQPVWKNWFENALSVQFNHRLLAYGLLILSAFHALWSFRSASMLLAYGIFAQACLGILALVMKLPLAMALSHQALAMIVVALAAWNLHKQTETREIVSPAAGPKARSFVSNETAHEAVASAEG